MTDTTPIVMPTTTSDGTTPIYHIGSEQYCLRCSHVWRIRRPLRPTICPKCKSPYFDKAYIFPPKDVELEASRKLVTDD